MSTPSTLELDLRLLDILASLPQRPDAPPSAEALRDRLTEVCAVQGIPTHPDAIARTVTVYLAQQAIDARLLALLQEAPAKPPRNDSTEALCQRLDALRRTANVPATPESIQRAIATYRAQTAPFPLWVRPQTEAERQDALAAYARCKTRGENRGAAVGMGAVGLFVMGMLGLGWTMLSSMIHHHSQLEGPWLAPSIGALLLCVIGGPIAAILVLMVNDNATVPWPYRKWLGAHAYDPLPLKALKALKDVTPDLDRLQRWLGNEQARAALRQLSQTAVPITEHDAVHLDGYVRQAEEVQANQARKVAQQAWTEGLAQLRQ
jgi:hypothetical protein